MKNKYLSILICLFLVFTCFLTGCFKDDDDTEESGKQKKQLQQEYENDFDDPAYQNEQDGAEIVSVSHPEDDFIGKWAAKSDYAEHLYGNVSLTINTDHTWTGDITNEKFSGKWASGNNGIIIKDAGDIINWNLFFVSDGNLVFQNLDDTEVTIVLKPVG